MINNVSFKGYIPVYYYAKYPVNGEYIPVRKRENIRKCNGYVVRNLNGTLKKNKNKDFVEFYSGFDSDYKRVPKVHSVYDKNSCAVFLFTGEDADQVSELAKPIGRAKAEAGDLSLEKRPYYVVDAASTFYDNIKRFINKGCSRLKSSDGKNLSLRVYFNPKYNSKDKLTSFEFVNARFVKDNEF